MKLLSLSIFKAIQPQGCQPSRERVGELSAQNSSQLWCRNTCAASTHHVFIQAQTETHKVSLIHTGSVTADIFTDVSYLCNTFLSEVKTGSTKWKQTDTASVSMSKTLDNTVTVKNKIKWEKIHFSTWNGSSEAHLSLCCVSTVKLLFVACLFSVCAMKSYLMLPTGVHEGQRFRHSMGSSVFLVPTETFTAPTGWILLPFGDFWEKYLDNH